ncbi:hypothetical protein M434DRAFT_384293 [Hypoxylon sp. CO27-5]|nr:hypothetical protein M434DRAFT_384293 [Hypoxylon sp. CO27-5]
MLGNSKRNWCNTRMSLLFYGVVHPYRLTLVPSCARRSLHLILERVPRRPNTMKCLVLLAYSAVASATSYFLTVYAPNTEVDGGLFQAAGQGFYTGTSGPATYCPDNVKPCPEVQGTLVHAGLTGMAVAVPGGQAIYVAPSGAVEYARAHSSYIPEGSIIGGWFNKTVVSDCDPTISVLDFLSTDGSNIGGVKVCPDIESWMDGTGASFRLYAGTKGFNLTNCVDAVGLHLNPVAADVGCWQYI